MSRISAMTIGLVMIMIGAQLFVVRAYYLSPKTARFLAETFGDNGQYPGAESSIQSNGFSTANRAGQSWPYYRSDSLGAAPITQFASNRTAPATSYASQRMVPPRWLCWPIFFLGAVFFLHGVALRNE